MSHKRRESDFGDERKGNGQIPVYLRVYDISGGA